MKIKVSGQLHPLCLKERAPATHFKEAGWAPEPTWKLYRREISLPVVPNTFETIDLYLQQ
jgi:hypothetical protein